MLSIIYSLEPKQRALTKISKSTKTIKYSEKKEGRFDINESKSNHLGYVSLEKKETQHQNLSPQN